MPYRKETYTGQAPQSFYLKDILLAHDEIRKTKEQYDELVDQATLMRKLNKKLYIVEGNRGNIKVTTPEDVYVYKALLKYKENKEIGLD